MPNISVIKETAISLPFKIASNNLVGSTTDQTKIWADKVRGALGTLIQERVMRPRYGSSVPSLLFNSQEEVTEKLTAEITRIFNEVLTPLSLDQVEITFDEHSNVIYANVTYLVPSSNTLQRLQVGVAVLSGDLPIREEKF